MTQPGATEIEVLATVASRFGSPSNSSADKGTATISGQVVTWTIDELGTEAHPDETATLTYDIAVSCDQRPRGTLALHDFISYDDAEGGTVTFSLLSVILRGCLADIDLQPLTDENLVGDDHTVVATVTDDLGDPIAGVTVTFEVTAGPNVGETGSDTSDVNGEAEFTYTGDAGAGTDTIVASVGSLDSNNAEKQWTNRPPVAEANGPYIVDEGDSLTLSNAGSFDPDGDALTITWHFDGDDIFETSGASPDFPTDDGPAGGTVTVRVCDPAGLCDEDDADVTVNNVAPTADAGSPQTVFRNDVVDVIGTWDDPAGALDDDYAWTWDLDGDATDDDSGSACYGTSIDGQTSFTLEGNYTLTFGVTDKDGGSDSATVEITVLNQAPSCTNAVASQGDIWPVNHRLVSVSVLGVTDAEGDTITITITGIRQDEPVNAIADGTAEPDGFIDGDTAEVRAERSGSKKNPGNGRVYHIAFTATDGHGGSCDGTVTVGVPHDQRGAGTVDDGPLFDSTTS